jgi:hypothetical protein
MAEVPPLFFSEDFDLDSPALWGGMLGDVADEDTRQATLDSLSHYLVRGGREGGSGSVCEWKGGVGDCLCMSLHPMPGIAQGGDDSDTSTHPYTPACTCMHDD